MRNALVLDPQGNSGGGQRQLMDTMFQVKFTSKQLVKYSHPEPSALRRGRVGHGGPPPPFPPRAPRLPARRDSKKCEKKQALAMRKMKACMAKGDTESAKIYASNAIREKNQARGPRMSTQKNGSNGTDGQPARQTY